MSRVSRYSQADTNQYRKERKKAKKEKSFLRFLFKLLIVIFLIGVVGGSVYATVCIINAPRINPKTIYSNINLSSEIYDDEGEHVDSVYLYENRNIVKYNELPKNLKNAFVAIEDKTFWKHHGFNFKRMAGAVLSSFGGGGISGTSTITQQLARNVYLADIKSERSIKRKIIEMYYAFQIERTLDKEEILEAYLNSIYLGYGCYGVDSASRMYFSKDVGELNLEECASLAALPQAPDSYALIKTEDGEACTEIREGIYANDISQDRRYLVLDLMADQGLISDGEAEQAKKPLTDFLNLNRDSFSTSYKGYFKDYLVSNVINDLVKEFGISENDAANMVYTKGLKIYSTLDNRAQKVIFNEFKNNSNFPLSVKGKQPQAAMVITEYKTGAIKAIVGGRKPKGEMLFNRAVNPRQPGSSIKPLAVYGAALQKSFELHEDNKKWEYTNFGIDSQGTSGYGQYITASSTVYDEKMYVNGKIWPYNSNGRFTGYNTFRTAIQQSINTCAVKIQLQVGNEYSADLLEKFGLTTIVTDQSKPANDINPASLALGGLTNGVTPLEMSLAYGTFPNGGKRMSGHCYTKVLDNNGKVLLTGKSQEYKVIDEGVAWIMTDVLKSVVTKGIGYGAAVKGISVGGKTGTTNDQYDIWFDGFTPNYSASLWIGTDNNVSLTQMSGPAAALWGKIMKQIPKALKGKYLKMPDNITKVNGEYYTKGTEPGYYDDNSRPVYKKKTEKTDKEKKNDKDKKNNSKKNNKKKK